MLTGFVTSSSTYIPFFPSKTASDEICNKRILLFLHTLAIFSAPCALIEKANFSLFSRSLTFTFAAQLIITCGEYFFTQEIIESTFVISK